LNVHAIMPVIAAIAYLWVAFFVYSKNRTSKVNKYFALMLLCVSVWNIDIAGIINAPNPEFAILWGTIFRNGLLFIPPAFLHFILVFTHSHGVSPRARRLLRAFYGTSCFFAVINWTPYFTGGIRVTSYGYQVQSGPLFFLFVIQFVLCGFFSIYFLIQGFLRAERYQRQRFKYFFLALGVSFIAGSWNFFPLFGVDVYLMAPTVITIGLFIAAYSVIQNRLMDVGVFLARGLGYIMAITTLALPAVIFILFLEDYFFQNINPIFTAFMLITGIASGIVFNYLKPRFDRTMHQIIVRDKYKYHEVLEEFSRRLVTIIDLNRLLHMLADTIEKSMGVKQISIFLNEPEKDMFRARLLRGSPKEEMIKISPLGLEFLQGKKEAILLVDLERAGASAAEKELLNIMGRLQAEVCLPLIYMNRLIGFIFLGSKAPEEMYYSEDLDLLYPLANQVAIAIENANLYENLKKSQNIMRRADRLASLGTLIASLAHEIRNPLVSIKTFTQLLPERIDDEEFRNYFLKVASGEIDRLTGLINELLGFARPSEPRLEGEDVNSLIDKMEILVATEARKKNVTLNKNYARDLPQIKADAEQLKQVLLNLLLNAIQSTKGEGKIWIETRQVQVPFEDKVEPFTQIEVRDTGVGIPKENLERIFDPFFSTRPEGSGLGLAISHQIVHDHGGFISVESEVGKGTSFKIHLPLKPGGKGANPK
jgi:two-component system NtrC family sensor kinase